jgi:hypothetical protein
MGKKLKRILVNRYSVLIGFIIIAAAAFYVMILIRNYLFEVNLPYFKLEDQFSALFGLFIKGVVIHYVLFLFIAIIGWRYATKYQDKHKYMVVFKNGFSLSTLFMVLLGGYYLIIYFLRL